MAIQLYKNNAVADLAVNCDVGDTTITVDTGLGALFSSPGADEFQMATLVNLSNGDVEIVKITSRSGDVLTVDRAQESTTEEDFPASSSRLEARITAGMLNKIVQNNADDQFNVAIGTFAESSSDGVAVGRRAKSLNSGAVGVGYYGEARAAYSVAVGYESDTKGDNSVGIGSYANAYGANSVGLGEYVKTYADKSLASSALPCVQRDNSTLQLDSPAFPLSSMPVVISSPYVDLGQCVAWQASTSYKDGDVVIPTTPNGNQYLLRVNIDRDFDESTGSFVQNYSLTSGGTEPTWPTTDYNSITANTAGDGDWYAMDWETAGHSIEIPSGMIFYPDEVGFICYNFNAVTAEPYVSIGTSAAPTTLVNNQQLTDITDDNMRHRFTGLKKGITGNINFKLVTKATGASSRFFGRFYAKGILIQKQDQA